MTTTVEVKTDKFAKQKKEDARLVKGRFYCHEPKGGSVKFSFRKYKGDPVKTYYLQDGRDYELPVAVIKHLNNCGWDVHSHILDANGEPTIGVGKKERRFTFQNLDLV